MVGGLAIVASALVLMLALTHRYRIRMRGACETRHAHPAEDVALEATHSLATWERLERVLRSYTLRKALDAGGPRSIGKAQAAAYRGRYDRLIGCESEPWMY